MRDLVEPHWTQDLYDVECPIEVVSQMEVRLEIDHQNLVGEKRMQVDIMCAEMVAE